MQYARNGRYGFLQEGSPGREGFSRSLGSAFVLRSELFAERNPEFERDSASATVNKPSHSDTSSVGPTHSWFPAIVSSFKLGRQPSSVFQSCLHSTPRSSDLETPRP